jgi:hypothetical protein
VPITIAAVGDIMMGSTSDDGGALPAEDGKLFFGAVAPILQAADLTFGNLEGPLVDEVAGIKSKCDWMQARTPGAS